MREMAVEEEGGTAAGAVEAAAGAAVAAAKSSGGAKVKAGKGRLLRSAKRAKKAAPAGARMVVG